MNWKQLRDAMESTQFAMELGVISGRRMVREFLEQAPQVRQLSQYLRQSPDHSATVVERVRELATAEIDRRYENPYDSALAGYLWALRSVDRDAHRVAAELAIAAPQTWWARELATVALEGEEPEKPSSADSQVACFHVGGHAVQNLTPWVILGSSRASDRVLRSHLLLGVHVAGVAQERHVESAGTRSWIPDAGPSESLVYYSPSAQRVVTTAGSA